MNPVILISLVCVLIITLLQGCASSPSITGSPAPTKTSLEDFRAQMLKFKRDQFDTAVPLKAEQKARAHEYLDAFMDTTFAINGDDTLSRNDMRTKRIEAFDETCSRIKASISEDRWTALEEWKQSELAKWGSVLPQTKSPVLGFR